MGPTSVADLLHDGWALRPVSYSIYSMLVQWWLGSTITDDLLYTVCAFYQLSHFTFAVAVYMPRV
jgi:hypothetical protein